MREISVGRHGVPSGLLPPQRNRRLQIFAVEPRAGIDDPIRDNAKI